MTVSTTRPTPPAVEVLTVDWAHPDADVLRAEMSAEVGPRYAHIEFVGPPPTLVDPRTVHKTFVAYADSTPAGHAAVRWNAGDLELKRMFVRPDFRGTGTATALLAAAEAAACDAGQPRLILQTGHLQPDAVRFYERSGYHRIPLFAPYHELPLSNCFAKHLA
ncbi:GNAT family N-acetyltransferase [Nocardia caishijiensis]|uniref:Acetyltransferase (GNAT) family protein n=1 Tax=Nocardia caishijiensis TaxID=184756 RepID=A0ABQ6YJ80_9NOCA|nr:GNAT family N-acetyltransferase [Nocardia caishijiensis]KAF0845847.1 acetyltransferase (GNAT) family protein [Nocardia caishijiensis]